MANKYVDGNLVAMTAEEIAEVKASYERYLAALPALNADEARSKRNSLLEETDWTASSDLTMSSDMTTYRQYLRDIPKKPGFPTSMAWPTKP